MQRRQRQQRMPSSSRLPLLLSTPTPSLGMQQLQQRRQQQLLQLKQKQLSRGQGRSLARRLAREERAQILLVQLQHPLLLPLLLLALLLALPCRVSGWEANSSSSSSHTLEGLALLIHTFPTCPSTTLLLQLLPLQLLRDTLVSLTLAVQGTTMQACLLCLAHLPLASLTCPLTS